jgi:hypothetical protein
LASKHILNQVYKQMRAAWPKRMDHYQRDPESRATFITLLSIFDDQVLKAGVQRLILTRAELYPDDNIVALIGEAATKCVEGATPDEVTDWIEKTVRARGSYYDQGWPTEEHARAVRMAGGWKTICACKPDEFRRTLRDIRTYLEQRAETGRRTLMERPDRLRLNPEGKITQALSPAEEHERLSPARRGGEIDGNESGPRQFRERAEGPLAGLCGAVLRGRDDGDPVP